MKCPNCKKKCGLMTHNCKYCNLELCMLCRDINLHNCSKYNDCKAMKLKELKDKLDSEKVIGQKIIKI